MEFVISIILIALGVYCYNTYKDSKSKEVPSTASNELDEFIQSVENLYSELMTIILAIDKSKAFVSNETIIPMLRSRLRDLQTKLGSESTRDQKFEIVKIALMIDNMEKLQDTMPALFVSQYTYEAIADEMAHLQITAGEYNIGYYNGLEAILAILEGRGQEPMTNVCKDCQNCKECSNEEGEGYGYF